MSKIFAIIVVVCQSNFNIFAFQVDDRVADFICIGSALQQIKQAIFAYITFAIISYNQTRI